MSRPLAALGTLGFAFVAACVGTKADDTDHAVSALSGDGLTATLATQSDWGSGYCDLVTISNSGAPTTGWQAVLALNSTYSQSWNATVTVAGGQMTATSLAWNGVLATNASASFGFCGTATTASARPTLVTVTATRPGGSAGSGGALGSGGKGASGGMTGSGGNGSGGATASGGATGSGGKIGSGGAASGGAVGSGGTPGSGGSSATGGSNGSAGSGPSGLPAPPGSSSVPAPNGAAGNVTVLNWAGFKGAVSYTFDDDNSSQIQNYGQLQALGVPFTFYMWTGRTEASNSVWATAVKDGHEIGNHTQSHTSNGTTQDIDAATTFIKQHLGVTAWTMAAPNGAAIYTTLANGRFLINRGVADNLIGPSDGTDRFNLPCYIPPTGAGASQFNAEVDSAQSTGKWRVILVHGFTGGTDSAYQPVPLGEFINGVRHTIALGNMWIGRVVDVGSYWLGQKAFSQAITTTSGSSKTWSWTLPSNFPPGKYLRVTASGGKVSQNGVVVPWNGHGYYEIALDARALTVAP